MSHHHVPSLAAYLRRGWCLVVLFAAGGLTLGFSATEPVRRAFDVPAGPAETTLKQFSEQSGAGVLFVTSAVAGVQTRAVQGTLASAEALDAMLAGTPLIVTQDSKTGAFAVRRATVPNESTPAPAKPESESPNGNPRSEKGMVALDRYEVRSTKINGPVNQTIFSTDETGVFHYQVMDRTEIDRYGVTSMEELFRYVPQTSDYGSTALQGQVTNTGIVGGGTYQNSEVKLRGFSSLQTSILINGRRLQRGNLSAGADLNRIPVAAIERIEILPSSASAVYGGGAIGGVINIILRKDYTGRDLTAYVGTSTEGGATEYHFTYFEGRSFNHERTRLSLTLSTFHRDALYLDDRDFLQRALERYPASSSVLTSGRPIYEQYIIPTFAANPGTIIINSTTGGLGVPGNTTARFAAIPKGLTADRANALTPADFVTTAGQTNFGSRFGRSVLYRPEDRYSLNATIEHAFVPEKLELYSELGASYMRSSYSYPQNTPSISLTATDPLNPFRTGVTPGFVGVPITIVLDPTDLPDPSLFQDRTGFRGVLGLKGKFSDRWEWSLDGTGEYGRSHSEGYNPTQNLVTFLTSTSTVGLTQVQRRALYNPLVDHSAYPATSQMAPYLGYDRHYIFRSSLAQVNFRLVGDVLDLPAGPLRVSPGGEVIWAQYQTASHVITAPDYLTAMGGTQGVPSYTSNARRTESAFVEVAVPIIGSKWRPIPLHAVDLNLAGRWEGTDDSTDKATPTAGIRVALTRDIALRIDYAEGFFPPDQSAYEGAKVTETATTPFTDPFRGNVLYNYPHIEMSGGNPGLRPEKSKAWSYGVVLTPRFASGLTLTADYWRIKKVDAISTISGPSFVVADPLSYPGRVIRAEPTATDLANGWLGAVTSIDWRPTNVGYTFTDGVDLRSRYAFSFANAGKFTWLTTATWTRSFRDQVLPTSPVVERVGSSGNPLRWRGNTSLFWERQAWLVGLTARYIDRYKTDTTTPSAVYPAGTGYDGEWIPSAVLWDLQLGYRIPVGIRHGFASWFNGTQWTLGCENILNREPAYRTDRYGFYSRYEDPRMRYVYLQIKKSL